MFGCKGDSGCGDYQSWASRRVSFFCRPSISFNPAEAHADTLTDIQVGGTFVSSGDRLVFLPAGAPDCEGAVHASATTGGIVNASMSVAVRIASPGVYKACLSRVAVPTLDSQYIYLGVPQLRVTTPSRPAIAFGPGTFLNEGTNQCEIACTEGGRRMEEERDHTVRHPDAMDVNSWEPEQLFGQPTLA